jgi:hypothetical protein
MDLGDQLPNSWKLEVDAILSNDVDRARPKFGEPYGSTLATWRQ